MRAITTIVIVALTCLTANAQQVWTEGTTWEIHTEYTDYSGEVKTDVKIYELGEPVSINDTIYYTLTKTYNGRTYIESYIRAEEDDSYVYIRQFQSDGFIIDTGDSPEMLLYDFSKPFEYGDTIWYGVGSGYIAEEYIDPAYPDRLSYFYDIIEPGDCLPAYCDIIYKIGFIDGPVSKFYEFDTESPNTRNVSHVLFKTKGKPNGSMITLRIDVVRTGNSQPNACYSLTGVRYTSNADNRVLFKKGNVLLMR